MKKRRMMLIPEVNPKSFIFFFERGTSGASWSIRDYSIRNRVKEYGPQDFRWNADDICRKAEQSFDAPTHQTGDLTFWHQHTGECNARYFGIPEAVTPAAAAIAVAPVSATVRVVVGPPSKDFPLLNLGSLQNTAKGRKPQDMERMLHSPNSEDWVTWHFFQLLPKQFPSEWWGHIVSAARRKNQDLHFPFDDRFLPVSKLWMSVRSPLAYETSSRARMLASGNPEWISRAQLPDPVEGSSEIDIALEHDKFVVFIEAKLGSDVNMDTKHDPQRNQIARNIDCLIEKAGDRMPIFWMLVRDDQPGWEYVRLMKNYKNDPGLLARDLPHRDAATLNRIAQNLTVLLWSDFHALVCSPGIDAEENAVKRELERRISPEKR
jgi:hypothetical protein